MTEAERWREAQRLVTQQNRDYAYGSRSPDCVFCDHRRLPADRREVGGAHVLCMVFEPLNPVTPGHLLVVPVPHVTDATTHPLVSADTMGVAAIIASRYESANIITSIGQDATQTVMHLHLHVVPRRPGDGLRLPWSPDAPQQATGELHLHRP